MSLSVLSHFLQGEERECIEREKDIEKTIGDIFMIHIYYFAQLQHDCCGMSQPIDDQSTSK